MIGIISLAFGLVTPPYGLCLLIAAATVKMRLGEVLLDVLIMLVPMLLVLVLVILWPDVTLFIPNLISPEFLND
jgi:TRAP-type C4-dicarboxylate transport system permease large subunit